MGLNSPHHSETLASSLHSEGGFGRAAFNVLVGAAIIAGGVYLILHWPFHAVHGVHASQAEASNSPFPAMTKLNLYCAEQFLYTRKP